MSLKGLQLSPEVLAKLFTQPLHPQEGGSIAEKKVPVDPAPAVAVRPVKQFLGDNNQRITVLVKYTDAAYLDDALFEFFTGILNACKLSMKDIALVNLAKTPGDYQTIAKETNPSKLLMLGMEPLDIGLPMQFPAFQIYTHNKISYLSAPALEALQDDKALKAALWKALKVLFEL